MVILGWGLGIQIILVTAVQTSYLHTNVKKHKLPGYRSQHTTQHIPTEINLYVYPTAQCYRSNGYCSHKNSSSHISENSKLAFSLHFFCKVKRACETNSQKKKMTGYTIPAWGIIKPWKQKLCPVPYNIPIVCHRTVLWWFYDADNKKINITIFILL